MPFDTLLHFLGTIPPDSRQPLLLAAAGLVLLAFLHRGRGVRAEGPRPRAARWANRQDLRPGDCNVQAIATEQEVDPAR